MLWYVPGRGLVDDSEEGVSIPEYGELRMPDGSLITWGDQGVAPLPQYSNRWQYGRQNATFQWRPDAPRDPTGLEQTSFEYGPDLLRQAAQARAGTLRGDQLQDYEAARAAALAVPTRDIRTLRGDYRSFREEDDPATLLGPTSPDLGAVLLGIDDRMAAGTATPQERDLYNTYTQQVASQTYDANKPDPFSLLGDNLFSALAILGTGITGGLAAAPLAAGGAGLATTLGSLGTLAGTAGGWAGTIGGATDQEWLQKLGLGLSVAGGLTGGLSGLANVLSGGVNSISDAARLAQSAGKITGALGRIPGADPLKQASRYLGLAGSLGQGVSGVQGLLGTVQGVTQGATQTAQDLVTQRGGADMESDYSWDYGDEQPYDNWSWDDTSDAGGNLWSTLGSLASGAAKFLGSNASWLGPLVSSAGSLAGGAIGSQASRDASAAQANALNRGLDLQTAQWLQQQANQAPWLKAGQQALPQLQQLAGQGPQAPFQPGAALNPWEYTSWLPGGDPGWQPQTYQGPQAVDASQYRYTPGQGPQAGDYRYTPGQTPDAAAFASGPPQLYQGAMPGSQVPTLTGQQVLDQDPGYQFRQDEARRALEASAAFRGSGMSGSTLGALGRQSSDLASQEYQNAWQRMMGRDTEQYGRNWNQYLQNWNQGVTGTQLGLQTNAQNFGQSMSAAQLREQVNQVASSQGWSQAQAEAAFREQVNQQASQQGFSQALQGQGQQFTQGLQAQQWNQGQAQQYSQEQYNRLMGLQQVVYGRAQAQNQTDYERQLAAYNSQLQNQGTQWNRLASLAGMGQTAVGQLATGGQATAQQQAALLGQLGNAQAGGTLGSGQSWMSALSNVGNAVQGGLSNAALLSALQSLKR